MGVGDGVGEATVVGERDWLPDPRLVNPELRARTTRNAMDLVARLLARFAREARGAGWSWSELARSVTAHEEFPNWTISGAKAFESVTGQAPGVGQYADVDLALWELQPEDHRSRS